MSLKLINYFNRHICTLNLLSGYERNRTSSTTSDDALPLFTLLTSHRSWPKMLLLRLSHNPLSKLGSHAKRSRTVSLGIWYVLTHRTTNDNHSRLIYHFRSQIPLTEHAGFEPANAGVKVLCLTAWRMPNKYKILIETIPPLYG